MIRGDGGIVIVRNDRRDIIKDTVLSKEFKASSPKNSVSYKKEPFQKKSPKKIKIKLKTC
jgi:hypothetical protein